jgi:PhnB protein
MACAALNVRCIPRQQLAKEEITMAVKPIPEGYHSVTPYLVVQGVPTLLDFLKRAFDATEIFRMPRPDGTIMHAEVKIGDSIVMMGEATGEFQPMPGSLHLYVNDADATYQRALQAGATSIMEPADQFYGDRSAGVQDTVGNRWWIATHREDVPPEELRRRADAFMQQQRSG